MPNNVVAKYRLFLIDFGCINEQEMFDKIISDNSIINQLYNSPDFVYLTNCDDVEIKNRANSFKQLIRIIFKTARTAAYTTPIGNNIISHACFQLFAFMQFIIIITAIQTRIAINPK